MAAKNDITMDTIRTRIGTQAYNEGLDKVDFTVKLADLASVDQETPEETYRYLEVSLDTHSYVAMPFRHPDHNLKITFDGRTGQLIDIEKLGEA